LTGKETFEITGATSLSPRSAIQVTAKSDDGKEKKFAVVARVDTPEEVSYYQNGGILTYVLRQMI
jgi:aconitate hydratase